MSWFPLSNCHIYKRLSWLRLINFHNAHFSCAASSYRTAVLKMRAWKKQIKFNFSRACILIWARASADVPLPCVSFLSGTFRSFEMTRYIWWWFVMRKKKTKTEKSFGDAFAELLHNCVKYAAGLRGFEDPPPQPCRNLIQIMGPEALTDRLEWLRRFEMAHISQAIKIHASLELYFPSD